jgi:hypothetical protein
VVGRQLLAPVLVCGSMMSPTLVHRGEPVFLQRTSCLCVVIGALAGWLATVSRGIVHYVAHFACAAGSGVLRFYSAMHAGGHIAW